MVFGEAGDGGGVEVVEVLNTTVDTVQMSENTLFVTALLMPSY